MPKYTQTIPVRVMLDIYRVFPPHADPDLEPVVVVQGVVDLNPDLRKKSLPLWFDAEVQIRADRSVEIQSFGPTYGSVQGARVSDRLTAIYEHALLRGIRDTNLKILGVR